MIRRILAFFILLFLLSACGSSRAATEPTAVPSAQTPTSEPTLFSSSTVNIYLIALDDSGQKGEKIGCNDSVVPVAIDIEPTNDPMTAALTRLLDMDEDYLEQSGLYNVFHQSDLHIDSIQIENQQAIINLSGALMLGGVCDDPRVSAQLEQTALQFADIQSASFFINGEALESVLSEK